MRPWVPLMSSHRSSTSDAVGLERAKGPATSSPQTRLPSNIGTNRSKKPACSPTTLVPSAMTFDRHRRLYAQRRIIRPNWTSNSVVLGTAFTTYQSSLPTQIETPIPSSAHALASMGVRSALTLICSERRAPQGGLVPENRRELSGLGRVGGATMRAYTQKRQS